MVHITIIISWESLTHQSWLFLVGLDIGGWFQKRLLLHVFDNQGNRIVKERVTFKNAEGWGCRDALFGNLPESDGFTCSIQCERSGWVIPCRLQTISFSNAIHWFLLGKTFPQVGLMSDLLIWWFSQIRVEKNCRLNKGRKFPATKGSHRRSTATFEPKFASKQKLEPRDEILAPPNPLTEKHSWNPIKSR